jgi:RHS repeat-associated protein
LTNKKPNGSIIEAYNYGYDANGNISQKVDGKGTTAYTYDKLNRVLTISEPGGKVTTYEYDTAGNRSSETTVQSGATIAKNYGYNSKGWLTWTNEVNGTTTTVVTYTYDANGNQISKIKEETSPAGGAASGSLSNASDYAAYYSYDAWNNMTLSVSGSDVVENCYDGSGLRYGKKVNGGDMTISFYEYDDVILEINQTTNAQTAVNVYGNGLISRNGSYFMYNGHGDVTAVLDGSSNILASYYYDAFGVHTSAAGVANNPYRYSGYMFDEETGLYYLKSRYYDPETARVLSEDTYRGDAANPLSLNLYAYVSYNPLKYLDPTGHWQVGDELLSGQAQYLLQSYTQDYFKAQANGNSSGMASAQKAAEKVRADYASTLSYKNLTPTGAALTTAIRTNGYLTAASFNQIVNPNSSSTTTAPQAGSGSQTSSTSTGGDSTPNYNPTVNSGSSSSTANGSGIATDKSTNAVVKKADDVIKIQSPQITNNYIGVMLDYIVEKNYGAWEIRSGSKNIMDIWINKKKLSVDLSNVQNINGHYIVDRAVLANLFGYDDINRVSHLTADYFNIAT